MVRADRECPMASECMVSNSRRAGTRMGLEHDLAGFLIMPVYSLKLSSIAIGASLTRGAYSLSLSSHWANLDAI